MTTLRISIVDSDLKSVPNAEVTITRKRAGERKRTTSSGDLELEIDGVGDVTLSYVARGYQRELLLVSPRTNVIQIVLGLRREGEKSYTQGTSRFAVRPDEESFLLAVNGPGALRWLDTETRRLDLPPLEYLSRRAGPSDRAFARIRSAASRASEFRLSDNTGIRITAYRTIQHGKHSPIGLGHQLAVRFHTSVSRDEARTLAASLGLAIQRSIPYAGNAYLLSLTTSDGVPGYELLDAAERLLQSGRAIYAEPNLLPTLQMDAYVPNDPLWPDTPYLESIGASKAWETLGSRQYRLRGGSPEVTIAVIDADGVDPTHADLTATLTDGTSKLLGSWDFTASPPAPEQAAVASGDHGTQCAGTATAAFDNQRGLAGVAPNCHLLGTRVAEGPFDPIVLADALMWLAGSGHKAPGAGIPASPPAKSADVFSMSWGINRLPLPGVVQDCLEYLTTYGRNGRGCVFCFSIGNSGFLDFTDSRGDYYRAWAAYERTLAVGACIGPSPTNPVPQSVNKDPFGNTQNIPVAEGKRALYSPFGNPILRKPDLVVPSSTAIFRDSDGEHAVDPIVATVRTGTGDINGCLPHGNCHDYKKSFGGTSHSTPAVAGAVALLLSVRPELNWVQIREVLRKTCTRVDLQPSDPAGQWQDLDNDGEIDFSPWYGAGRLNVDKAVGWVMSGKPLLHDAYVRHRLRDNGDLTDTEFLPESPDIWVRQDADEALPALPWNRQPDHQNPIAGQENLIIARVRNRGNAIAPIVYMRVVVAEGDHLEVEYPDSFELGPGTTLVAEELLRNIAAGSNKKALYYWDGSFQPSVTVSGLQARAHPCLLLEACPNDGPATSASCRHSNNVAVRNMWIIPSGPPQSAVFDRIVAGSSRHSIQSLMIDASGLTAKASVLVHAPSNAVLESLVQAATAMQLPAGVVVVDTTEQGLRCLRITGLRTSLEIPLLLSVGSFETLLVKAQTAAKGALHFTQRRSDGHTSAGFILRMHA